MKLISLNIWGGALYAPLMEFLEREAGSTDIFCFQELHDVPDHPVLIAANATPGMGKKFREVLHDFRAYPAVPEIRWNPDRRIEYRAGGVTIFVRRTHTVAARGNFVDSGPPVAAQYVTITAPRDPLTVLNLHGYLDIPSGKRDNERSIEQNGIIIDAMNVVPGPKIIAGDFNLRPETQSMTMFERAGFRNLNRERGIKLTRSEHYTDMEKFRDYVSDYIFVSPDIRVKDYRALQDVVSDHLPLMIDFE